MEETNAKRLSWKNVFIGAFLLSFSMHLGVGIPLAIISDLSESSDTGFFLAFLSPALIASFLGAYLLCRFPRWTKPFLLAFAISLIVPNVDVMGLYDRGLHRMLFVGLIFSGFVSALSAFVFYKWIGNTFVQKFDSNERIGYVPYLLAIFGGFILMGPSLFFTPL